MKTKHTPGPWTDRIIPGNPSPEIVGGSGRIASCPASGPVAVKEYEANARLIAAAPDLLAACEELFRAGTVHSMLNVPIQKGLAMALSAIAAAKAIDKGDVNTEG